MNIAQQDKSPGAYAVTVSCIRCHRRRQLSDVVADLDGPPFWAYFCVPECVPHNATDAAFVYRDANWQLIGQTWKESE